MTKAKSLQYFDDKVIPSVGTSYQPEDQLDCFISKVVLAIEEEKLPKVSAYKNFLICNTLYVYC